MGNPLLIRAHPSKSAAIAMLEAAQLPIEDLAEHTFEDFLYAGPEDSPKGLVGLEINDSRALLRSLVVDASVRGQGIGQALVRHAETHAHGRGVHAIYLLTTTAETFFRRLGYMPLDRAEAPPSIQSTREFSSLCPQSSAFMVKALSRDRDR